MIVFCFKKIPSYGKEMLHFDLGDYAFPSIFSLEPFYTKD
jgi:hypothetical protein